MQMERYPGRLIPTYILERGDGVVVVVVGVVVAAVGAPGREGVVKAVADIAAGNCAVVDAPAGRIGGRVPGTEAIVLRTVAAIAAGYCSAIKKDGVGE
jgi:hypothetical protein